MRKRVKLGECEGLIDSTVLSAAVEVDAPGSAEEGGVSDAEGVISRASDVSDASHPLFVIGGLDVSFVKGSDRAVACLAVLAFPSLRPLGFVTQTVEMDQPYVAGFLAFREAPMLVSLVRSWQACEPPESSRGARKATALPPDARGAVVELLPGWKTAMVAAEDHGAAGGCGESPQACAPRLPPLGALMVDGNGFHHPRRCGNAVVVGLECGLPCLGVGKALHAFGALTREGVLARAERSLAARGQWVALHAPVLDAAGEPGEGGAVEVTGACMQAGSTARRPVFVSVGSGLSLGQACGIAAACMRHRLPEPVRQADLHSRAIVERGAE